MMDSRLAVIGVLPDHFFVAGHFRELGLARRIMVAGDDRVAVFQTLHTTGVIDRLAGQVIVGHPPNLLALCIHLDHQVTQGATDQGVAIG